MIMAVVSLALSQTTGLKCTLLISSLMPFKLVICERGAQTKIREKDEMCDTD